MTQQLNLVEIITDVYMSLDDRRRQHRVTAAGGDAHQRHHAQG